MEKGETKSRNFSSGEGLSKKQVINIGNGEVSRFILDFLASVDK